MGKRERERERVAKVRNKWKDSQGLQIRLANKAFKAGADMSFQNLQGNSALHFASHRGHLELVDLLLALKANPRLTNSEGNTPLMYAAHSGHEEVCAALLEAAAPVDVKNRAGLNAQMMAERRGFKSCAALVHAYALAPKQARTRYAEYAVCVSPCQSCNRSIEFFRQMQKVWRRSARPSRRSWTSTTPSGTPWKERCEKMKSKSRRPACARRMPQFEGEAAGTIRVPANWVWVLTQLSC